jgi:regulator of sigma E protease
MLSGLWGIFWTVSFLGGSIFIHELGHFLAARRCGLWIPRFSMGFGPKLLSWRRGETEFRISLIPLGGYVLLPELMEPGSVEGHWSPPQNRRLRPLSLSRGLAIACAGPLANLLLALCIGGVLSLVGRPVLLQRLLVGEVIRNSPAQVAGLQPGDELISWDGVALSSPEQLREVLAQGREGTLVYRRSDEDVSLSITPQPIPLRPAHYVGKNGAVFIARDGGLLWQLPDQLGPFSRDEVEEKFAPLEFFPATRRPGLGVVFSPSPTLLRENPFAAVGGALGRTLHTLGSLFSSHSAVGVQDLMGVPAIAHRLYQLSLNDFRQLLWFALLINVGLAVLNLLPIPGLDGGQLFLALLEKILPRRPIAILQNACMLALFALLIYVCCNDIRHWSSGGQQPLEKMGMTTVHGGL